MTPNTNLKGEGAGSRWRTVRRQLELSSASATKRTTMVLLVGVLGIQLLMIGSYVGALHAPKPRDVPIAVVGPQEVVRPALAQLRAGGVLKPRLARTLPGSLRLIDRREVYAVLIPGASSDRLIVAQAASASVAELLPLALRRMEPAGRRLSVQTVKRLPANDPRGLSPFYLVVGWLVGGYIGATVLGLARGGVPRSRGVAARRLATLGGYALVSGLLGTIVVQQIVGVLGGHFLALAAVGALVVFATGAATAALQSLFGIAGTALAVLLFVALGNPASGGPLATELLMPGLWRVVGPFLPPGAGTTLVRNISYFNGNAIGDSLLVLGGYAVLGCAVVVLARRRGAASNVAEVEAVGGTALAA